MQRALIADWVAILTSACRIDVEHVMPILNRARVYFVVRIGLLANRVRHFVLMDLSVLLSIIEH
jgi:hypothetical protein